MQNGEDEEYAMERIGYYLEIGAIRLAGYNDDGEAIFELNEDITKRLAPELWEAHIEYTDKILIDLYKDGLVNVEYDEDLNAIMHFSEEGLKIAKEKGALPIEEI
jgi:hypothetical protein